MRPIYHYSLTIVVALLLYADTRAADQRHHDDATLRAVQFIDEREGWAVGDEGVIWHTIDGGKNWERQASGVRSSLQSLHFLSPYVGWVVGREELPGGGSVGVALYTRDGGLTWRRALVNSLPGLHLVRFVDDKTGYVAGEGSDQFPSGIFATTNGGGKWHPLPGPGATAWRGGDFDAEGGALGGAWNRLATVRRGKLYSIDMDTLGGRAVCGVQLRGQDGVAVGQGGLVLLSKKGRGSTWHYADLKLSPQTRAACDFHAVGGVGQHIWAVGRPGSVALHSPDMGQTWRVVKTGQPMPLCGVYFRDENNGWAVGELGTVICTKDGGKTWQVQRRGGQKMTVLHTHARPTGVPLDTVALLGAQDGYLTAGLCVTAPEPTSAALSRVGEPSRLNEAFRLSGGATANMLWQFPLTSHLARNDQRALLKAWDRLHGDRAAEQLLSQLILAIRTYRPEVVLTDSADGGGAGSLIAEAMKEAFARAGDKNACPEQIDELGLEPWQPKKLYGLAEKGPVRLDLTAVSHRLGSTVREYSTPPLALLGAAVPPGVRSYRLLADSLNGAISHKHLMQGISVGAAGVARRTLEAVEDLSPEAVKGINTRASLWAIAEAPANALTSPDRLLAQIGPALTEMPLEAGARVAHGLARQYARRGQWALARETYLLLAERYPTHPLAIDAYRWLLMHQSSSEARRRHEMGQFVLVGQVEAGIPGEKQVIEIKDMGEKKDKKKKIAEIPTLTSHSSRTKYELSSKEDARRWYSACLGLNKKLSGFGPLHSFDPALGFCVQSARRQLGEVKEALEWYRQFAQSQPDGPWKRSALAELWLASRVGEAPKPAVSARPCAARPYLDGKLDDACWQEARPVTLKDANGKTGKENATEVRMSYDRDFLYVAVKCSHSTDAATPKASQRTRDGDMRKLDRVSLMLDLDRDYATCFHLQVDASGCVAEDCWGDRSWNPRWFVATHREPTSWTFEAAIPRDALSADHITPGRTWAANVVRVLPGKGVQAMSLPAEAPDEAMRPEGMGLLMFIQQDVRKAESKAERGTR